MASARCRKHYDIQWFALHFGDSVFLAICCKCFVKADPSPCYMFNKLINKPHQKQMNQMEFQWKWGPFWHKSDIWAKSAFWAQKSVSGAKMQKFARKCILGPKSRFSAKVTKKLTTASALRKENRDSRLRAQTASTGARGSENL